MDPTSTRAPIRAAREVAGVVTLAAWRSRARPGHQDSCVKRVVIATLFTHEVLSVVAPTVGV
jgi:hypothetical protein